MEYANITIPEVAFDPRLDGSNVFHDVFGNQTLDEWFETLKLALVERSVNGVDFPTSPPDDTQNRIHGHSGLDSLNEAFSFYRFACQHRIAGPDSPGYNSGWMLDYGAGWGRILRPFIRDFPLRNIIGYEPSGQFCTVARGNNPFVTFLNGGYLPDGFLPADRFSLIVGWSIYSHISESLVVSWLNESARILAKGGACMYTTWGRRFLDRLRKEEDEMKSGGDIHWYSKLCLTGSGDINQRIQEYDAGQFVWFNTIGNSMYGETFMSRSCLQNLLIKHRIPLTIEVFDNQSLAQDVFILRKV